MKRLFFLLLLCPSLLAAQDFLYKAELLSYFDNREYGAEIQRSQTLMGVRVSPEIGWGWQETPQISHRFMVGMHFIQPMGSPLEEKTVVPTAYYQYSDLRHGLTMSLGAVPFTFLQSDLPGFLMYDSLTYMHPNIQGGLFQYRGSNGFAEFFCDWRGRQTEDRHEAFRLVLTGRYYRGALFAGGIMQLNHLANRLIVREGVSDDLVLYPYAGINLPLLDSCSLQAGYIVEYERNRSVDAHPAFPQGAHISLFARWKRLGLSNTLYAGDNLFPLYPTKGKLLNQGDPFYQSSLYNRTDLFVYLIRNRIVNCLFSWNFHYTQDYGLDHQQQLIVRISTEGLKESKTLNNLFGK